MRNDIHVIPKFLDCGEFRRRDASALRARLGVMFAGEQHDLAEWLSAADLFLLPSSQGASGWRHWRRWRAECR